MNDNFLKIENLTITLNGETILRDVNIKADKGEIVGIIGKNGSGKSVLFKAIVGFFIPQRGNIYIKGENIVTKEELPLEIGALIEEPGFFQNLSGLDNLKFLASIQNKITVNRIKEVLKEVGLEQAMNKKVKYYSMGMRQRLGIAQAYMENPELIILDEPMNNLDEKGVEEIRKLIKNLASTGKTILLSSHDNKDIELLTNRVYKIEKGLVSLH